jgi:hypothetical protein
MLIRAGRTKPALHATERSTFGDGRVAGQGVDPGGFSVPGSTLVPSIPTHDAGRGLQRTNVAPAHQARKQYAAERAIDDPAKLARAARIVRLAIARNRLSVEDIAFSPSTDRRASTAQRHTFSDGDAA